MIELSPGVQQSLTGLLAEADPPPFSVRNEGASAPFLLVCDHAGRRIPQSLGELGLIPPSLDRHIACDIGAAALTLGLAAALQAQAILQPYSRLVVDCNRSPDRADAIPEVADGTPIPGNLGLGPEGRSARVAAIHTPYHDRIASLLDRAAPQSGQPLLVLVHSFTPVLAGQARPWHVGVLHRGGGVAEQLLELLRKEPDLVIGDNEPYVLDDTDYTAPRHAEARGLAFLELEIRQDLLATATGQAAMTDLLARLLPKVAGP